MSEEADYYFSPLIIDVTYFTYVITYVDPSIIFAAYNPTWDWARGGYTLGSLVNYNKANNRKKYKIKIR